jgi:hypothetical protein
VHDIGRIRLHHTDVPIVALIVDEQVTFSIYTNHFWGSEKVLSLRSISEARLPAGSCEGIHVFLINLKSSNAMVVLIGDIGHSRVYFWVVREVLLLWSQVCEWYVFDAAEIDFFTVDHLVHVGTHLISIVFYLCTISAISIRGTISIISSISSSLLLLSPLFHLFLQYLLIAHPSSTLRQVFITQDELSTLLIVLFFEVPQTGLIVEGPLMQIDRSDTSR